MEEGSMIFSLRQKSFLESLRCGVVQSTITPMVEYQALLESFFFLSQANLVKLYSQFINLMRQKNYVGRVCDELKNNLKIHIHRITNQQSIYIIQIQNYMINTYQQSHHQHHLKQLSSLFKKGFFSQLSILNQPFSYTIPSLIACKMYEESTIQLMQKDAKDPLLLMWFIISSYMAGLDYKSQEHQLKMKQQNRYLDMVEDWTSSNKPVHHEKEIKTLFRHQYEKLVQKAQEQNYFTLKNMPVFLVPMEWFEKFYNDSIQYIPAVDGRELCQAMPFIDTDQQFMHFNYKIKEDKRENNDFKIVSLETWKFLHDNFGGTEIRRFTTPQKQSSSEVWLKQIRIIVVENRCIHTNWELTLLASRFDTISRVIERTQRLLVGYGLANISVLKKKWEVIKTSLIETNDLIDLLQNQEKQLSKDFSISQGCSIQRLQNSYSVEECEIYAKSNILLMTIDTNEKDFINLDKVPYLKVITSKQACLTCRSIDDIFQCSCKSVYFCSKECKIKNKEHEKICRMILREESQINNLFDHYNVKRKVLDYGAVKKYGKVGLQNLGNTCYFNAALQCVLAIDKFNKFFSENHHLKDINVTNVLGSEGHLACVYGQFIKDYYTTNRRALEPTKILRIIAKNSQFRGHAQQDSQEFLNYFLDKLHEDLNRVKKKPYVEEIESDGRPDKVVSAESWQNYLKRNQSFIAQTIAGQYRSQIRCPDCDRISITFDPYLSVTLPFPKEGQSMELTGYYLTEEGQFNKVSTKVKPSMNSQDFINRYFHVPVIGQWLVEKKPSVQWKNKRSVERNNEPKGILLFYPKEQGSTIEFNISIEDYKIFNRRIYSQKIQTKEEFMNKLYLNIKKPFLKALKQEEFLTLSNEEYLEKCNKMQFLEIIQCYPSIEEFPLTNGQFNMTIKINQQKLEQVTLEKRIKFDVSSSPYSPKQKMKFRSIHEDISIGSLIESFNEPERLTEENAWYCNKCKEHKLAQKIMSIYKVPEYLIIHLKRFNHKGNRYVIYGEKVKTPIQLEPIQLINGKKYELTGVVNHYGTLTFGHYTAYIKRQNQWYYCDDSSVKRSRVSGDNAYLLFYKMIK